MNSPGSPPLTLTARAVKYLWILLLLLLCVRLVGMAVVPLTDTTEARYGEIARKMAETKDWITPQFDYGVPFWAKPPLSTWLSAISITVFGANAFGARLPSLLLGVFQLGLIWAWVVRLRGAHQALLTIAVLAATVLFFAAAGAVMTDASLAASSTLAMIAFWNAATSGSRRWGYLFFVALGCGLLAKGPLIGVIVGAPIVVWTLLRRHVRLVWRRLPWLGGSVLMLAIALPWYVLAEHKTPGFLQYFILGEHVYRFVLPHWSGDKYGNAHAAPIGMIWWYWLESAFPFSLLALGWLGVNWRRLRALCADADGWCLYLVLWIVLLLGFFTFARNILWPYVLPGLPAFACLLIELRRRASADAAPWSARAIVAAGMVVVIGATIYVGLYAFGASAVKSSQRDLVQRWLALRHDADSQLVYYRNRYQSAVFYARGKITVASNMAELENLLGNRAQDFIALKDKHLANLTPALREKFRPVAHFDDITLLMEQDGARSP